MALPAGRYGVTKEQLRKIKRLPINTIGMITETKEGIAIIEDSAKASQLITAGTQFWHNGKLYSADVDIAKDADIITSGEGKNATEMPNITGQIASLEESKADNSVIAPVEDGATASQAYAVGEHFIRGGKFKEVTNDIAQGEAITDSNTTNRPIAQTIFEKGILTSANDLDTVLNTGIYIIDTLPANAPSDANYSTLIVKKRGTNTCTQIIFKGSNTVGEIYHRVRSGSPASWKPWFKFEGTIVS